MNCSAYCNIPLKIMAKYARSKDVKLNFNTELDDRASVILKPHDDLKKLEAKIETYMESKKGNGISKAEDWVGEGEALNKYIINNNIRNKHFNFSSKASTGYYPRIEWDKKLKKDKRTRYVYKA